MHHSHGVAHFPDPGSRGAQIRVRQDSGGGGSISVDGVQLHVSPQILQKAQKTCGHLLGGPKFAKAGK